MKTKLSDESLMGIGMIWGATFAAFSEILLEACDQGSTDDSLAENMCPHHSFVIQKTVAILSETGHISEAMFFEQHANTALPFVLRKAMACQYVLGVMSYGDSASSIGAIQNASFALSLLTDHQVLNDQEATHFLLEMLQGEFLDFLDSIENEIWLPEVEDEEKISDHR